MQRCLESLPTDCEVIVIDNGSQENIALCARQFPWVREIVRLEPNRGFAGAYNAVIDCVKTPYVVLVSNDTIAEEGAVNRLLAALQKDSSIGIAAPVILNSDRTIQETGFTLDLLGFPIEVPLNGENFQEVFYASGCFIAMGTSLFRELGGFSEHFQFFVEDLDLCWKVHLVGKKVGVVGDAFIVHAGGGTISGASYDSSRNITSQQRVYFRERNIPLAFLQNFGWARLAFILPIYMANSTFEALGMLITGRSAIARTYVRSWRDALRLVPVTLRKRRFIQQRRLAPDRSLRKFFAVKNRKLELILRRGLPRVD